MSDMTPHPLTSSDWKEIAALPAIREAWGFEAEENGEHIAEQIYAAKFNFEPGGPGYVGELIILQGDALTGDPPFVLARDPKSSELMVVVGLIEH